MRRLIKIVGLTILALLGLALVLVAVEVRLIWLEYHGASDTRITETLERDRAYDPAKKFIFNRACVVGPEVLVPSEVIGPDYHELDFTFFNSHTDWALVLIDDQAKTYRRVWIEGTRVAFDGNEICVPELTLVVEQTPAGLVARARW